MWVTPIGSRLLSLTHLKRSSSSRSGYVVWVPGSDLGEASVFAAAEIRSATAITDDQAAVRVVRAYGLNVHGTIWLLADACRDGKHSESAAGSLVDVLRATGLRLPCTGAEFPAYARQHGLL